MAASLNANMVSTGFGPQLRVEEMMEGSRIVRSSTVFRGHVEVIRADNGYIVQVGTKEGYEPRVFIAKDANEVNNIITAEIVKFRLEQK